MMQDGLRAKQGSNGKYRQKNKNYCKTHSQEEGVFNPAQMPELCPAAVIFAPQACLALSLCLWAGRKVRATEGAVLPNGKGLGNGVQTVQQKTNRLPARAGKGEKVG